MSDFVQPYRGQPTRLPYPWDSPSKNNGVCCHFLLQCMKVKSESEVTLSCLTPRDPMDCSLPGSSSMGFSRQEYWSGVPVPSPYMQSTGCEMPGRMQHKLESWLLGEISITSDMQMTPLYGRKWRGTKELLDVGERQKNKRTTWWRWKSEKLA